MRIWNGYQHGINFGGWFSQGEHTDYHYETFITEKDFATVSGWGLDHVRIPVDFELVETEGGIPLERGYVRLQRCLEWCRKYRLHMILDLHKTPGYIFDNQTNSREFFENPALQARFFSLWEQFAHRFGRYQDILAFELLNEVVDESVAEKWNQIAATAISAIRAIAPSISILVGGIHHNGADGVALLDPPVDQNIVYNFHCYEPIVFTHQTASWTKGMSRNFHIAYPDSLDLYRKSSAAFNKDYAAVLVREGVTDVEKSMFEAHIAQAVATAEKYNVPLYCGEYGVINQADVESTLRWYQTITSVLDKHHIGHAAWTYKKMDFGITDTHLSPIQDRIISLL